MLFTDDNLSSIITEDVIKNFKPTYLMIKRHKITGLKYFCKTVRKDFIKYKGSGDYWTAHIKKYGRKDVETIWWELFTDIHELVLYALKFSKDNDIVNARDEQGQKIWANLMYENGLHGFAPGRIVSESQKQMYRDLFTNVPRNKEVRTNISKGMPDQSGENNNFYGKTHSTEARKKSGKSNLGKDLKSESGKEAIRRASLLRGFRRDDSVYIFENVTSKIRFQGTRHTFIKHFSIHKNRVSAIITGQQKTAEGWRLISKTSPTDQPPSS